jgi:hypothetical protein
MLATLYRYSHPLEPNKFLYVGQGAQRDTRHRSGSTAFGRKFRRDFPAIELSQPIKEEIEVQDQCELNELETIWMFRFHTWRGYGGYNITIPGSKDYKFIGNLQPHEAKVRGGITRGKRHAIEKTGVCGRTPEKIRLDAIKGGQIGGCISGKNNVKSGQLLRACRIGGKVQGLRNHKSGLAFMHNRWHVNRNTPNPRCVLCSEQGLIVAFA